MSKLPIKKVVEGLSKLQGTGENVTLLNIGPMSPNPSQASFETTRDYNSPPILVASQNRVDADELGSDYVSGQNQERFQDDVHVVAEQVSSDDLYYLCKDYGGSQRRGSKRDAHLNEEEAMRLARQSYLADTENGSGLLMIDPTKDPFEIGKTIPLSVILQRIVGLIIYCEEEHKHRSLPEIGCEVGTEETNGGLIPTEKYREPIEKLEVELKAKGLPTPTFIVGQTGTLTRETEQVGTYNFHNAYDLTTMAKACDVGLREHSADCLGDVTLLEHIPTNVTANDVVPQYGTEETRAYLKLCEVEDVLKKEGLLEKTSSLGKTLLVKVIKTEHWRKWMIGEQCNLRVADTLKDEQLSLGALDVAEHYAFNGADVEKELRILYENLAKHYIDGQRFVVDHIKRPLQQYAECYHLKGVTSRVRRITE